MKKRGLSEVVTTLILVLLVLVAIAIVWVVISNLIRDKGDDIGSSTFEVSMAVKTVEPSSTSGNVLVRVERNVGEGNLQGINIIMSDGINSETVRVDPIDEGEETTYDISKGGLGAITKVSIRPIGGSEGNEKVGEVVGERELSYEQSVKSLGGLIAWWEFENDAKDSSGSVPLHDGTNNGATFVDDGKVGKAADFDGSNYISAGDITEYGYTICSWVYLNTGSITLYSFRGTYGAPLLFNNGGKYRVYMNDNSYRSSNSNVVYNQWVHLCIIPRQDSVDSHIYTNGNLDDGSNSNAATGLPITDFIIGGATTGVRLNGQIDELMIFNKALTADEVKSIYELTK